MMAKDRVMSGFLSRAACEVGEVSTHDPQELLRFLRNFLFGFDAREEKTPHNDYIELCRSGIVPGYHFDVNNQETK